MTELPDDAVAPLEPAGPADRVDPYPPRPLPATYWVVPGRFLAGEYPGSHSRAEAMERLRLLLSAGVTCFIDVTEPDELPSYESLLPFATPAGQRIEYLREPIPDHGIPEGHEVMARALALIDDALAADHVVYLHCRAGVGRSATVVGCWLAGRPETGGRPLERLQELWTQSARAQSWPLVPETQQQADFVRDWRLADVTHGGTVPGATASLALDERIRGALLGLAVGDAMGEATRTGQDAAVWTQHTALALCLAQSLLELGRCDARDQIDRYVRWQREGQPSPHGRPGQATPDVAKALATYLWRGLPTAGSHDPRDRTTAALPRVVSAAAFAARNPAAAIALAAECARTTHQSPIVLDACRYFAALLCGALSGEAPDAVLRGVYEPVPGAWAKRPLKKEFSAALAQPAAAQDPAQMAAADVVQAITSVRTAVATTTGVTQAIAAAIAGGCEPALDGALAGALAGAFLGPAAIPEDAIASVPRLELIEETAARLAAHADTVAGGARGTVA